MKSAHLSLCLGAVFLGVGCAAENPLDETSQGVGLTAATARSSSLALDAMAGSGPSCASVTTACTAFPCDGSVTITLGCECSFRLGVSGGTVKVDGHWTDANSAKVTNVFTDVNAGGKTYAFASVKELQVDRSGSSTTVRYSAANATARSGSTTALATTNNWTAVVDSKGTTDQNDDSMTISSQSVSAGAGLGTSAAVVQLDDVVISPDCDKNPISGTGSSTKIEGIIPKIDSIKFHSTCDGKAEFNNASYSVNINVE